MIQFGLFKVSSEMHDFILFSLRNLSKFTWDFSLSIYPLIYIVQVDLEPDLEIEDAHYRDGTLTNHLLSKSAFVVKAEKPDHFVNLVVVRSAKDASSWTAFPWFNFGELDNVWFEI